ncbi:hypothetical protein [Parabacteroides sp. PF5-6]|uniref:hypothetical protein n=1 Tax=Parabacteroides sp. PF5-6 TaxID=1742403 RepID=UPI00240615E9|nr:hypothetical protein [Parabacteroides sp. PF5-6]MDF9831042.1 hypothetical protein [Parabacteroides sp. PF5-6]
MKIGDRAKVNPRLTGLDEWVEGVVIDLEQNPFRGLVIAIKDDQGRIFFGEAEYFKKIELCTL